MRQFRRQLAWIGATIAPWGLASGLLVSFTASAGHNPALFSGFSTLSSALPHRLAAENAAPLLDGHVRVASLGDAVSLADTSYLNAVRTSRIIVHEHSPRPDLKSAVASYPDVDRSLKGDPLTANGLRRSLSRNNIAAPVQMASLIFAPPDRDLALPLETGGDLLVIDLASAMAFEPQDTSLLSRPTASANSDASPQAMESTPTAQIDPERMGATPAVPRALVLASATPAAADASPVAIAAMPVSAPVKAAVQPAKVEPQPVRSRFAGLVAPARLQRELKCLAEAVYFESRSEPESGQAAVAQVVLNRALSGLYPTTICGVVYQNRHRYLACQFTFACEGKSLAITEPEHWRVATRVARAVFDGKTYMEKVGAATHYHATYVRPYWASRLRKMDKIGQHVFYKLRPGQT